MRIHGFRLGLLISTFALVAAAESLDAQPWKLQTFGSLRAMIHENATGVVVDLKALLPNSRLYGVGALSDLRGEVTLVGGVAHVSYAQESGVSQERIPPSREQACLLVVAEVPSWTEIRLEREIPYAELDRAIAALAASNGVDTGQAFPFLVEGRLLDLTWHVIDGRQLAGGGAGHLDHLDASIRFHRESETALLVGFHSTTDHGVFTHRDSNTHVHVVPEDPNAAGHVDGVTIPVGAKLSFPAESTGKD